MFINSPEVNKMLEELTEKHDKRIEQKILNQARGGVKLIALYTGIGFRIYTREDIPDKTLAIDSPKWKRISSIIFSSKLLGREVDTSVVHLGQSEEFLENIAVELYKESEPLRLK